VFVTTSSDGTSVIARDEGEGPAIVVLGPGSDDGSAWGKWRCGSHRGSGSSASIVGSSGSTSRIPTASRWRRMRLRSPTQWARRC
jgi:hypothetical protein